MSTLAIDVDALSVASRLLREAGRWARQTRAVAVEASAAATLDRIVDELDDVNRRIGSMLASPLLLDPPQRTASLLDTVDRWIADPKWWARSTTRESTPVDPVVRVLAFDHGTRESFIGALVDPDSPDDFRRLAALLFGAVDFDQVRLLWVRATDPLVVELREARRRIEAVATVVFREPDERSVMSGARLDVVALERRRSDLRELLGELAAPWILHFTGLANQWNGDARTGRDLLERIADHDRAAAHLRDGLIPAIERAFDHLPAGHQRRMERIDQIAFAVGVGTEILRRAEIDGAQDSASTRAAILSLPEHLPLGLSWPAGLALGVATSLVAGKLDDVDEVRNDATREARRDRERLAEVAAVAARRAAIDDHLISPDSGFVPADVRVEIQHAADSVSNAADRGEEFASD